jgi:hypothetical protein
MIDHVFSSDETWESVEEGPFALQTSAALVDILFGRWEVTVNPPGECAHECSCTIN